MLEVTLLQKPGCHLCEMAERDLASLRTRYPHRLSLVDITRDPRLVERYGERIPVLQVGGQEYGAPLPRAALERALRAACGA
jgi:hypothetical protein